jgi:hypothetical protein
MFKIFILLYIIIALIILVSLSIYNGYVKSKGIDSQAYDVDMICMYSWFWIILALFYIIGFIILFPIELFQNIGKLLFKGSLKK